MTTTTGFFVDWDGNTRRIEAPGHGISCSEVIQKGKGEDAYDAVDVLDSEGFVIHEAVYYATIESIEAIGVVVNLIEDETSKSHLSKQQLPVA